MGLDFVGKTTQVVDYISIYIYIYLSMYLYFFHGFVEPFAAVLFFGSGFAPRLFIPSSQCDRSTERRY